VRLAQWLKNPFVLILIIGAMILAMVTRYYAIDTAPAGGDGDTAWTAIDAMDWLDRGAWPYYIDATHMPSPLMIYFIGAAVMLHGVTLETTRLVTATSSVLTVLLLIPTAWTLLADDSPERRILAALGAMAAAATSLHAMNVSRLGVNSPVLPFLILLSLWSAAAAWHEGTWWRWILAGIALAATQYIYISGHLMGMVAVLWFLHSAIAMHSLFRKRWRGWLLMASVTLLVVLPNLILYITWPESFTQRLDSSSSASTGGFIWNYDLSAHGGVLAFLFKKTWLSFTSLGISWNHNYLVGNTPVLTPLFFVAWIIGFFVGLWRFRRTAYGWVILAIPALLLADLLTSTGGTPHPMRQIGLLPFHYLLAGYGIAEIALLLLRLARPIKYTAFAALFALALIPTFRGFYQYIAVDIPASYADPETSWRVNLTEVNISQRINAHPEQSYLLPYGEYTRFNEAWLTMAAFRDRHSTLRLDGTLDIANLPTEIVVVLATDPNRARHDLAVDLDTTRWWLLLHEGQTLLLPPLTPEQEAELLQAVANAEPEPLIDASDLLIANFTKITTPGGLFVPQNDVPMDASFSLAGSDVPELRLLGYIAYPTDPQPGQAMEVSLYWQTLSPLSRNYEIAVQVWDDSSQSYGNSHSLPYQSTYRTRIWQTDEITVTHHMLFLSEEMPVGRYQLTVRVLRLLENSPLVVTGANTLPTGDGAWARDMRILPEMTLESLPPLSETLTLGDGLLLSGMSIFLNDRPMQPFGEITASGGETLSILLQWDVLARLPVDYSYFVHLIPVGETQAIAQQDGGLGGGVLSLRAAEGGVLSLRAAEGGVLSLRAADRGLPSGAWRNGDQWQDAVQFTLAPQMAPNDYELWLGVYNYADGLRLPIRLNGSLQADNRLMIGRIVVES
jgi:hypothetical protein